MVAKHQVRGAVTPLGIGYAEELEHGLAGFQWPARVDVSDPHQAGQAWSWHHSALRGWIRIALWCRSPSTTGASICVTEFDVT
jgi:hypothetical protein